MTEFASQAPANTTVGQSLIDMLHIVEEIDSQGVATPNQPVVIPAYNEQDRRGFAVIHTPPFSSSGPRCIRTGFTIPKEFHTSVREGIPSELGAFFPQKARDHHVRITVRVFVDSTLPPLRLTPDAFPASETPVVQRMIDGRSYWAHEWVCDEPMPVRMRLQCRIGVNRG